jgi:hypothetical protein
LTETADPSTTLLSGRDDNSVGVPACWPSNQLVIPTEAKRSGGICGFSLALADEIDLHWMGNDAALVAHGEKLANGFFPIFAVIERALVHVHADEAVG